MHSEDVNVIAFEEKVIRFQKENEEVKRVIDLGSDEHLDMLLEIKKSIDKLTENFTGFMNGIIPDSNSLTSEEVTKTIPSLLELYSLSIQLVASLKRSRVAQDLKTSAQNYYSQVENLREFIHDLDRFRENDEDGLDSILDKINSL